VEHVVFFPAPDGSPAFRRVPSLDEAVRLVEHLRNADGVATVSVHALTEVPLAFRAYYKVEVPAEPSAVVPVQPTVEPEPEAPSLALVEDVPADDAALAGSNGHQDAPSLGFFA
jgi:hypothetical protein